jgi:hypothetical protein
VNGTFHWINKIQDTTGILAQFTGLIMMNAEAVSNSYSTFVGLLEGLSHLGYILSGFTVFSMLRRMINSVIGSKSTNGQSKQDALKYRNSFVKEFATTTTKKQSQWSSFVVIFAVLCIGFPVLTIIYRKLKELDDEDEKETANDANGKQPQPEWNPQVAIAIADYQARGADELDLGRGDQVLVLAKPFPEWWEGEVFYRGQAQRGLFPYNFIEFPQQRSTNSNSTSISNNNSISTNSISPSTSNTQPLQLQKVNTTTPNEFVKVASERLKLDDKEG